MYSNEKYFTTILAAFIRGKLGTNNKNPIFTKNLHDLRQDEVHELIVFAEKEKLKMHKFKKSMPLQRIKIILGLLKGIMPNNLLDIGTGRGVFLWRLLDEFPNLDITCTDIIDYRVNDINAVRDGGISHIRAYNMNAEYLNFPDNTYDVVTVLEVLEHIPNTEKVINELHRVAKNYIILSFPSKKDNNPEHIHLFNKKVIENYFSTLHIKKIEFTYITNHIIVLIKK